MPYTLMKGLVWILLAVVLGIVVGWLLRSVTAKRQVERARAANAGASDENELTRLRSRVANLEPVVNERDRLKAELDAERRHRSPGESAAAPEDVADRVGRSTASSDVATVATSTPASAGNVAVALDLDDAAAVLGRKVDPNDLTVVEGIGPKIAGLCQGIGITTWAELAATEVSLLRTMLTDAGQRFKAHDPSTWPQQATLLAAGEWADFKALTDSLDGGRPVG